MMNIPVSAIPQYENKLVTNADMADNADIRRAIIAAVPKAIEQTKDLSKYFGRTSQRETCKAIFDFLKNEINYVADGYTQVVRLPSALLRTKTGDCKSYSVLTSAVLQNLGIPHHFVMVSYNQDPTPSHIYVATDDGCIIDAVWGKFDSEKTPTYKYKVKPNGMIVKTMTGIGGCGCKMNGCGCGCGCSSCAMGAIGKTKDERKKAKAEKKDARQDKKEQKKTARQDKKDDRKEGRESCGKQGAKTATLSAGRQMFLLIVRNNLDGLATKLDKMNVKQVEELWCKVGGNPFSLKNAIKIGASKKERRLGFLGKIAAKMGIKGVGATKIQPVPKMDSLGLKPIIPPPSQTKQFESVITPITLSTSTAVGTAVGQPAKGAAAGATFTTVVKALSPLILGALQIMKTGDMGDALSAVDNLDTTEDPADLTPPSGGGSGSGADDDDDKKGMGTGTIIALVGAAALGAYFIFRK